MQCVFQRHHVKQRRPRHEDVPRCEASVHAAQGKTRELCAMTDQRGFGGPGRSTGINDWGTP